MRVSLTTSFWDGLFKNSKDTVREDGKNKVLFDAVSFERNGSGAKVFILNKGVKIAEMKVDDLLYGDVVMLNNIEGKMVVEVST